MNTSTVMSQAGRVGNRNVMCAASRSESAATAMPDSSLTSRAAAWAAVSRSSTCPPSATIFPVPRPVFLYPSRTSGSPSPETLVSRQRQVWVSAT